MKIARLLGAFVFLLLALHADRAPAQTASPQKNPPKVFVPPPFHHPLPRGKTPDFRETYWGMSKEDVKRSETVELENVKQPETALEVLHGTSAVSGMPCMILYQFAENQLVAASYVIAGKTSGRVQMKRHTNDNDFLEDYETVKGVLAEKYGSPLRDETTWRNPLYRADPSHYGFAVSMGHLTKLAGWETPRTRLGLIISGDNFEITIVVSYQSLGLLDLAEKAKKTKSPF